MVDVTIMSIALLLSLLYILIFNTLAIVRTIIYGKSANLTNRGPSELVEERIFHALQIRTRTIIL